MYPGLYFKPTKLSTGPIWHHTPAECGCVSLPKIPVIYKILIKHRDLDETEYDSFGKLDLFELSSQSSGNPLDSFISIGLVDVYNQTVFSISSEFHDLGFK